MVSMIGSGFVGTEIALTAAKKAGKPVGIYDVRDEALTKAQRQIEARGQL